MVGKPGQCEKRLKKVEREVVGQARSQAEFMNLAARPGNQKQVKGAKEEKEELGAGCMHVSSEPKNSYCEALQKVLKVLEAGLRYDYECSQNAKLRAEHESL